MDNGHAALSSSVPVLSDDLSCHHPLMQLTPEYKRLGELVAKDPKLSGRVIIAKVSLALYMLYTGIPPQCFLSCDLMRDTAVASCHSSTGTP